MAELLDQIDVLANQLSDAQKVINEKSWLYCIRKFSIVKQLSKITIGIYVHLSTVLCYNRP
jgi:hypothetical protein